MNTPDTLKPLINPYIHKTYRQHVICQDCGDPIYGRENVAICEYCRSIREQEAENRAFAVVTV